MRIILDDPKVDAILVNIFGGITRGDEVARGLIEARAMQTRDVPMIVRIVGTNAAEAAVAARGGPVHDRGVARRSGREGRGGIAGSCRVSVLIGPETRLVVQGITGREGDFHSRAMLEYGTRIVAGMTPGKGGQTALDGAVPVFDTMVDAVRETGANTSCIFVPASGAPDAVLEAADAGIATIFCITEGIPTLDMIPVVEAVRRAGRAPDRPELSGCDVAGLGQGRHHPWRDPPRRAGSAS